MLNLNLLGLKQGNSNFYVLSSIFGLTALGSIKLLTGFLTSFFNLCEMSCLSFHVSWIISNWYSNDL